MRIIGLTGGIASGKSTIASFLENLGAAVVDADLLAREAVERGSEGYLDIVREFGEQVLREDGNIDRTALGAVVFADPCARRRLEQITHPRIRALAEMKLDELRKAGVPVAFYVAPLLLEVGGAAWVEEVWVVYVDEKTQVARLMSRDGLTREEALQRMRCQMPLEEKARLAAQVVDNSGSREESEMQTGRMWGELLKRTCRSAGE